MLTEKLDLDPLRRIRDKAEAALVVRISGLPWSIIKGGGGEFLRAADSERDDGSGLMRTSLEEVQTLAREYGVQIHGIAFERSLPETELRVDLTVREAEEDEVIQDHLQRRRLQDKDHETTLKARSVFDNVIDNFNDAVTRSSQNIQSFPELQRAVHELAQVRDSLPSLVQPQLPGNGQGQLPPAAGSPRLLAGGGPSGEDGLSQVLAELCGHAVNVDDRIRWRLTSDILHLIAEALLDGDADPQKLEHYQQRLLGFMESTDGGPSLDRTQVTLLRRLADVDTLRRIVRSQP